MEASNKSRWSAKDETVRQRGEFTLNTGRNPISNNYLCATVFGYRRPCQTWIIGNLDVLWPLTSPAHFHKSDWVCGLDTDKRHQPPCLLGRLAKSCSIESLVPVQHWHCLVYVCVVCVCVVCVCVLCVCVCVVCLVLLRGLFVLCCCCCCCCFVCVCCMWMPM